MIEDRNSQVLQGALPVTFAPVFVLCAFEYVYAIEAGHFERWPVALCCASLVGCTAASAGLCWRKGKIVRAGVLGILAVVFLARFVYE